MIKHLFTFVIASTLLCFGCAKNNDEPLSDTRTFYMGVTPWPADYTIEEVDSAYLFINNHCDIVSHHLDEGIPYNEAFNNTAMPAELLDNIQTRKTRTAARTKVFLSVSALAISRTAKAPYYDKATTPTDTKAYWENLPFDHADVATAYVNYISWLIDQLNPIYVNYGVESNGQLWAEADFLKYKSFLSQVYPKLKTKYPNIPFFISFMVDESQKGYTYANQLLPYTDFIGLSAYPYIGVSSSADGNTNPANFPANYFERFIDLAPEKPLAIAETGYTAQNLVIPAYSLNKQGTAAWQNAYFEQMMQLCTRKKAKLFIWFCHKDYDRLKTVFENQGVSNDILNLMSLWQDTGLTDENGTKRPIYTSWLNWMKKEKM
jgi:hypothetical protein